MIKWFCSCRGWCYLKKGNLNVSKTNESLTFPWFGQSKIFVIFSGIRLRIGLISEGSYHDNNLIMNKMLLVYKLIKF